MLLEDFLTEWNNSQPTIMVHTSGSTGKPKEMHVEKNRMLASAKMTCDFLGLKPDDTALLCMPLDYIAGKMVVVRSLERRMRLLSVPPTSHPLKDINEHINFAAFVPMQVVNTLKVPDEIEKFKQIDNVIIGGGAIDYALECVLRAYANNIYSTYGMTETLSHIALRRIAPISERGTDCLQTAGWYTPFANVKLSQTDEGCLIIDAPMVCANRLITNDIVELNEKGQFRILGRKDNTINTGGVKVQIEEVEAALRNAITDLTTSAEHPHSDIKFIITSSPDSTFGEVVVILIPENMKEEDRRALHLAIQQLPKYWQPKKIVEVATLPLTETCKPDRATAKLLAKQ